MVVTICNAGSIGRSFEGTNQPINRPNQRTNEPTTVASRRIPALDFQWRPRSKSECGTYGVRQSQQPNVVRVRVYACAHVRVVGWSGVQTTETHHQLVSQRDGCDWSMSFFLCGCTLSPNSKQASKQTSKQASKQASTNSKKPNGNKERPGGQSHRRPEEDRNV